MDVVPATAAPIPKPMMLCSHNGVLNTRSAPTTLDQIFKKLVLIFVKFHRISISSPLYIGKHHRMLHLHQIQLK